MQFKQLIEVQKSGALKASVQEETGIVTLGGMVVQPNQLQLFVRNLGWLTWDMNPVQIIDKTNKFVKNFSRYIEDSRIVLGTEITFENHRISNSLRYFDRIKLINPLFNHTILYNMPSTGGVYAIYDANGNTHLPEYTCRSIKQVVEYFNELL